VRRVSAEIPILTTMTFDTRGHTMMGVAPEQAVEALLGWGAAAVGGNCGNGPEEILDVIGKMNRKAPQARLVAKANAGVPEWKGGRAVYGADPAAMADYATAVADRGAWLIGACCGSTPEHLQAMADALGDRLKAPSTLT
jgi:5-methyltetrahydrofolate--homocysteine methyltransferase